jgi:uncharacterized protein (DUF111 family)
MLLLVNVDDISGEIIPYLIEGLMERGAGSVHVVQAITKKGRLEFLFFIDTPREAVHCLAEFLAAETGTLGVRAFETNHIRFEYRFRTVRVTFQSAASMMHAVVQVKEVIGEEGEISSRKAEQEDLRRVVAEIRAAGHQISFPALKRLVEQTAAAGTPGNLGNVYAALVEEEK